MLWLLSLPQEGVSLTAGNQVKFHGLLFVNERFLFATLQQTIHVIRHLHQQGNTKYTEFGATIARNVTEQ